MNYELALELKNNGFPQGDSEYRYENKKLINQQNDYYNGGFISREEKGEDIACPSLEELIEVCGDDFNCLFKHPEDTACQAGYAVSEVEAGFGFSRFSKIGKGKTHIEAVAKLWLELHKHDTGKTN